MKTLQIIQTISKICKILSKVVFVCCIVGFCLCIVGIISTAIGGPVLKLGGVSFESILQTEAGTTVGSLYALLAMSAIVCVGEGVLAKFASHYFERELKDGTPFNIDSAKELMRLGILSICIPIAVQIVVQIVVTILTKTMPDVEAEEPEVAGSVTLGVMAIVLSLVCRYGAELNAEKAENAENLQTAEIAQTPEVEQAEAEEE